MDYDSIVHAACRFAHLCGYGACPPLTQERLSALPDGKLTYRVKRRIGDAREVLILDPRELLRRLATPRWCRRREPTSFDPTSSRSRRW